MAVLFTKSIYWMENILWHIFKQANHFLKQNIVVCPDLFFFLRIPDWKLFFSSQAAINGVIPQENGILQR